ncbi:MULTISPECIES: chorismate lyase [Vibrio]|jgi:chorismate--pyruvate lyase|uniref:Chorismate lyase n=4 Tax=Vibrio cyclitrophicus TaxID=47951 RepID=A0ACD5FXV7_9VIBR|nr:MULTISPECIES: chorismate lyase [Vibrio]MBY7663097.1 chorismate lyase [Vibrio atlanticus]MBE8607901.1 chorismate lyase [Vibrio sp. OPT10]MBU2933810.1 chorismate lyase [Vibrio cyclitrophicus]MCC4775367.1 chorismate lyase [Vibrio cyclitrophicus]MCC4840782.1 chorismate lyase [Vibrio cyclitrophicus]
MNQPISLYLNSLMNVDWQSTETFDFPNKTTKEWLMEQGSLSRKLGKCCQHLSVELLHNQVVERSMLQQDEEHLLSSFDCLLRKVILKGDDAPWVLGRTLIPRVTLEDHQHSDLSQQGNVPLGLTVFSAENVERDALQVGWVIAGDECLLARRSRLWMNHKPMLVAELFLPTSPIYSKESV